MAVVGEGGSMIPTGLGSSAAAKKTPMQASTSTTAKESLEPRKSDSEKLMGPLDDHTYTPETSKADQGTKRADLTRKTSQSAMKAGVVPKREEAKTPDLTTSLEVRGGSQVQKSKPEKPIAPAQIREGEIKPSVQVAIQKRLNADKTDMKACIEGGHIAELREQPSKVAAGCSALRASNRNLFNDPAKLTKKWEEFKKSDLGKSCEEDLKSPPPEPTFDLKAKGYHNDHHANEMYADTVVKLHQEGVDEGLCMAGGTMAYFHDLVQGLDGFPGTGRNENVTAKFLNFLIDEQVEAGAMDPDTGNALKALSNASIVGGTLLVPLEKTPTGNRNLTPQECVNNNDLKNPNIPDFEALGKIRETMAQNDISRTQMKDESGKPAYTQPLDKAKNTKLPDETKNKKPLDESTPVGKEIGKCYAAKEDAFAKRTDAIATNTAYKTLQKKTVPPIPMEQFARVCQSVRMLAEIKGKFGVINEPKVVNHFRNREQMSGTDFETTVGAFRTVLKTPKTWGGDPFSEAAFARISGHEEYANTISDPKFTEAMANLTDAEADSLIQCALSDIQDGKYIKAKLEQ